MRAATAAGSPFRPLWRHERKSDHCRHKRTAGSDDRALAQRTATTRLASEPCAKFCIGCAALGRGHGGVRARRRSICRNGAGASHLLQHSPPVPPAAAWSPGHARSLLGRFRCASGRASETAFCRVLSLPDRLHHRRNGFPLRPRITVSFYARWHAPVRHAVPGSTSSASPRPGAVYQYVVMGIQPLSAARICLPSQLASLWLACQHA